MSISIALIPLALAIRTALGPEQFEEWVHARQLTVTSTFTDKAELVKALKHAGYDAEPWNGSLKTRTDGENFVFWDLLHGKWQLVGVHEDSERMRHLMMTMEVNNTSGQKLFDIPDNFGKPVEQAALSMTTFPTNFRDSALLIKTLRDFGAQPVRQANGEVHCRIESSTLRFIPVTDGPYRLELEDAPDIKYLYRQLQLLDEDYGRGVQSLVYNALKGRVNQKNLSITHEEVMEDNSIVLTLTVNE